MTVNWNTHQGILRDIGTSFSNTVRFSNYKVALAGNVNIACNGIKLKKVKHHVRDIWPNFIKMNLSKLLQIHLNGYLLKINSRKQMTLLAMTVLRILTIITKDLFPSFYWFLLRLN